MDLTKSVVDIFLSTLDQIPGPHGGPMGRLTRLVDCIVRKYQGPGQVGERVVVEARNAFKAIPEMSRNVQDGTSASVDWSTPELLGSLSNQLVSVCKTTPRVYSDSDSNWSAYPDVHVLSDKLTQDVYHTSDHTIQVPDGCQVGDSTGCVWTETALSDTGLPITSAWFGIKSKLGAWVTTPRLLYGPNDPAITVMAKIVSDGTRFWVFWTTNSGGNKIGVAAFNEQGLELGSTTITRHWADTPGYWDVTYQAGGVFLAQPASESLPTNVGVTLTKFSYTGSIVSSTATDATMLCNSGVAWLTNDFDAGHMYLATMAQGSPSNFYKLYAYRIDPGTLLQTHQYDASSVANLPSAPDTITGWLIPNGGNFDVRLAYSMLSWAAQVHGPVYDPGYRNTNTVQVLFAGATSSIRTTQSVILVSRAFQRDGQYFAYTYYQSGSGRTLQQTPIDVTITTGDYMLGNGSQPVVVKAGDFTQGAQLVVGSGPFNPSVIVTSGSGAIGITNTDTVAVTTLSGAEPYGILPTMPVLRWTFSGLFGVLGYQGSQMTVSGSSIASANGTWDVIYVDLGTGVFYTPILNATRTNISVPSGTFTAAGTVQAVAMASYQVTDLSSLIDDSTVHFFRGVTFSVAGAAHAGNNGSFTSVRVYAGTGPNYGLALSGVGFVWAQQTTQVGANDGYTLTLPPATPGQWSFQARGFDAADVGATLAVDGARPEDNGVFSITSTSSATAITTGTDASATIAQVFSGTLPTVSVDLPLSLTPYTLKLASVTFDHTYIGAYVSIEGALAVNNGTYQIYAIDTADSHTVYLRPVDGNTAQVNESFSSDDPPTITILLPNASAPEFQPIWFITPLDGKQPQVGCLERGLAYADWRFDGQTVPNLFPLGLSSPFISDTQPSIILPYRAKSFTAGETVTAPNGTATSIVTTASESTIGLKRFRLDQVTGQPVEAFNELIMPGPLGGGFTSSGFHEQGINVAPEAPFLVAEDHDTSIIGVSPGAISIQVTFEWMDENGERGYSAPSPPLEFTLQEPNNGYTIGGRLPLPLDSNGQPTISNTYGVTNRAIVGISLYRTVTINGIPSVQLYKFTNDLNVNGLYNGTGTGSGFAFPNSYTWYYRDQSLDAAVANQESLYTSKGLLPRYPAPPFSQGDVWENRTWLVGYDKAVWVSGDKQEGDGNWFFPGWRITLSGDDPVAVKRMEQYLVIGGTSRMWYMPAQGFPNSTGTAGSFPLAAPLPFPNGCTGHMVTSHIGTVYSSTAGGCWVVTRDLQNKWLSEPIKDQLGPVTGIAVDQNQRIAVTDGGTVLYVYDPIPMAWYAWQMPSNVQKLSTFMGQFCYQDSNNVLQQVPGQYLDTFSGGNHPITPDLTLAGITFGQVRSVKRCWEMQLIGTYQGPHNINAVMTYPDDTGFAPTTFGPAPVSSSAPYLIAINPKNEEAGQYGLRVFASFEGVNTPGNSFSLEMISASVGLNRGAGQYKLPAGQRVRAN